MVSNSLPYRPHSVSKMLRRDIHDLKVNLLVKAKARIRSSRYSRSAPAPVDVVMEELEGSQSIENTETAVHDLLPVTLYEFLEDSLKAVYTTRNRNMSYGHRWLFRGSWMVLWSALQACPSNACYDILGGPTESMTLLDLLEHKFAPTSSPPLPVSRMSVALYEGGTGRVRIDSAVAADPSHKFTASKLAALELWYGILEAATDTSKLISMAESLLVHACPEMNAVKAIETIGNPSKQFHGDDELQLRFRDLLFPSYNTFAMSSLQAD